MGGRGDKNRVISILEDLKFGRISVEDALLLVEKYFIGDMGFAVLDHHRELRKYTPEVVYCEGKTVSQIESILDRMLEQHGKVLATRLPVNVFDALRIWFGKKIDLDERARVAIIAEKGVLSKPQDTGIVIITAGTSDIPIALEAKMVLRFLGHVAYSMYDVGVAGIHRLFHRIEKIKDASVVIVVAGMDGALASVVAGICSAPIIAVPTSVGYGASFGGIAALLSMLNACAPGVCVVNIDNGFGAAYMAHLMIHVGDRQCCQL